MPAATEFDDPNARDDEDEELREEAGITPDYDFEGEDDPEDDEY
jgi:hypothetical protein